VEEGWEIAIAEALMSGTPVIAYNLPIYEEIFGEYITKVDHNVETAAATAFSVLNKLLLSPSDAVREQESLIKYARQFAIEKVAHNEFRFITN
jgi:glycosyltransferase involved in cell wall biosynthesis